MPAYSDGRRLKTHAFSLTKWYLDCVTELGDAAIIYCADLRWHRVRAIISGILTVQNDSIHSRTSIAGERLPTVDGDIVSVAVPKFGLSGKWKSLAIPLERNVFEDAKGYIRWNCLQPRSEVELRIGDRTFRGLGYAECLTLTVPPWQLPLRHLQWGRYLSAEDSLVWVDWQGPYSTRFAFHNGQACQPESVSDSQIVLSDSTLSMDKGLPLRSGRIGDTLLPNEPGLGRLFPHSLFNVEENKWRSIGTFRTRDYDSSGWAIHEVVHWNT